MPTTQQLGLDINGTAEPRTVAFDYLKFPEIIGGATLQASPTPVIQQEPVTFNNVLQPALSFGTPSISGTQVLVQVSLSGGTAGAKYPVLCKAWIAPTVWLYVYGDIVLIGPS